MPDIKETLIDLLTGYSLDTYEDVQYVVDELIAKGVLPVVRCKDCKHGLFERYTFAVGEIYICHRSCAVVHDNHFCSYGERKDGEN